MKKIYLVQKMERNAFKYFAHKGIKVRYLSCYGQVITMWCESKRKAIITCRKRNHEQNYEVFFVVRVDAF